MFIMKQNSVGTDSCFVSMSISAAHHIVVAVVWFSTSWCTIHDQQEMDVDGRHVSPAAYISGGGNHHFYANFSS